MAKEPIFQSAFGIQTGDIVRTSYGSGPFRVFSIYGPRYWDRGVGDIVIRTWPVISLGLSRPDHPKKDGEYIINYIRQEGDRWFTDSNDEVFVEKAPGQFQISMFGTCPVAEPYLFDPAVDYTVKDVWKCDRCGDFNAPRPEGHPYWHPDCPKCGRYADYRLHLMPPREVGIRQLNAYVTCLQSR